VNDFHWQSWFTGYCDGEASFTYKTQKGSRRVAPQFKLCLSAGDESTLAEISSRITISRVFHTQPRTLHPDGSTRHPRVELQTTSKASLLALVAHFDAFPLQSRRRETYGLWRQMVLLHAQPSPNYAQIARLAYELTTTSHRKKGRSREGQANLRKLIFPDPPEEPNDSDAKA
jgi:hypothetical protein